MNTIDNAPYRIYHHNGLSIQGYSRAGVQSYWQIPELDIGFDFGASPCDFVYTSRWFLSHCHLDHLAALPVFLARRQMMKLSPPTIYVPYQEYHSIQELLTIWQKLDRGPQTCRLIPVEVGDRIALNKNQVVEVFATQHKVPSCGYMIWEQRQKLKPEFQGLSGEKIKELRQSGMAITETIEVPILAYTGDTNPVGLDGFPALYQAKILIVELSFLRPLEVGERQVVHLFGHMHLEDFLDRADLFQNELIIATHVSTRYSEADVHEILQDRLPQNLKQRLRLWM